MKTAIAHLKSVSPYSQSRYHLTPKLEKESAADYEDRTWRNKAHYDKDGNVFIPPMSFKLCLDDTAKRSGKQIPGKGKSTYTKHFVGGVLCTEPVMIGVKIEDAAKWSGMMDSQGKKGSAGGTRVLRHFPDFPEWEANVVFYVLDDVVTEAVFEEMLAEAGRFVGIGRFRPQNGGYYGRFEVIGVKWAKG